MPPYKFTAHAGPVFKQTANAAGTAASAPVDGQTPATDIWQEFDDGNGGVTWILVAHAGVPYLAVGSPV